MVLPWQGDYIHNSNFYISMHMLPKWDICNRWQMASPTEWKMASPAEARLRVSLLNFWRTCHTGHRITSLPVREWPPMVLKVSSSLHWCTYQGRRVDLGHEHRMCKTNMALCHKVIQKHKSCVTCVKRVFHCRTLAPSGGSMPGQHEHSYFCHGMSGMF